MSDEPKDLRIPIMMSTSEVKTIDDWSFENRIRSRAEAIRRLCQMGLAFDSQMSAIAEVIKPAMEESVRMRKLFDDPSKLFPNLNDGIKTLIEHIITINVALGKISDQARELSAISAAYKAGPEVENVLSYVDVKSIIDDLAKLGTEEYKKKYNIKDDNHQDTDDGNSKRNDGDKNSAD